MEELFFYLQCFELATEQVIMQDVSAWNLFMIVGC
jgi:hypothetical protein